MGVSIISSVSSISCLHSARIRHVMADYCLSSTLSDLKMKILDLSADLISSNFTLANMGKEIDMDDARTLGDVGILDGDILTLVPARV